MSSYFANSMNGSHNGNTDPNGLTTSIPSNLKTLVRLVMRAFYNYELGLCMDMLMAYPCISQDDLAELLRLDSKQVQQHLANLQKEKFVTHKSLMVTKNEKQEKQSRLINYYFINYKMMVNVIKYKLDKIRIQIESQEKQTTTRANFKCTNSFCGKTYSDLDTKDIFPSMKCIHCGCEVDEDASTLPAPSSRNLLAKFNTQMQIIFEYVTRVEHVRLADDLLRPTPFDMTPILEKINNTSQQQNATNANGIQGPGQASSNQNQQQSGRSAMFKYDGMGNIKWSDGSSKDLLNQTKVSINFDMGDDNGNLNSGNSRKQKELPSILLLNQTTDETITNLDQGPATINGKVNKDLLLLNNMMKAANDTLNNSSNKPSTNNLETSLTTTTPSTTTSSNGVGRPSKSNNNVAINGTNLETIILQKLLIHEKKSTLNGLNELKLNSTQMNGGLKSSITITKKRDLESPGKNGAIYSQHSGSNENSMDSVASKKRKLNNGDIVNDETKYTNGMNHTKNGHNYHHYSNQKSFSDGSDREMDEDIEREYDDFDGDRGLMDEETNDALDGCFSSMPAVKVQNRFYRLDKITPKLINLMNESEKEYYINICRQLYTEIYEI